MADLANATPRDKAEALLTHVTNKILSPYGKTLVSDVAWEKFSGTTRSNSVVVVGEVSRGKSALANALVESKNSSPVGVDITTSLTIALGAPTPSVPAGSAELFYSDRSDIIPAAQLKPFVTTSTTTTAPPPDEAPTRAFVAVESPLGDAVVIDTPGVGGLEPEHAQLAGSTANHACVVVVVCDSSTPITAPEMAFIKETGKAVDNVIVAVSKIDKHFSSWRHIVAENKKLLRQHVGRDIPVVGVSSLLALYDAPNADAAQRARVREASGMPELRALIAARFTNSEHAPSISGLHIALEGMKELKGELETKLTTLTNADAALPELSAKMEHLTALRKETEQWEQFLQRDLTATRQTALDHLDHELEELKSQWTQRINTHGMAVLRKNPEFFTAQMEQDFQRCVLSALEVFTSDLHNRIVAPRLTNTALQEEITAEIAAALAGRELSTGEAKKKTDGVVDPMMLMMGVSGGSVIGTVLAGMVSFTGLGVVAGVGWVAFNVGFRAMRSGKTNLLNWLRENTATAKMFTNRLLESAIASARPAIVIRYRTFLKEEMAATQQHINQAEKAHKMEQEQRHASIAQLEKNIDIITKNIQRTDVFISRLKQLPTTK